MTTDFLGRIVTSTIESRFKRSKDVKIGFEEESVKIPSGELGRIVPAIALRLRCRWPMASTATGCPGSHLLTGTSKLVAGQARPRAGAAS